MFLPLAQNKTNLSIFHSFNIFCPPSAILHSRADRLSNAYERNSYILSNTSCCYSPLKSRQII